MKVISTTLKLACCPLAFHDIAWAKNDVDYRKSLGKARVYMVAKKLRIDFCNVKFYLLCMLKCDIYKILEIISSKNID